MTCRYRFISEHAGLYKVKRLCRVPGVHRSGYTRWAEAAARRATRAARDAAPAEEIHDAHTASRAGVFSNFKLETLYDLETRRSEDAGHARREIFPWIAWYNHRRRHSRAHYHSPVDYENRYWRTFTSADDSATLIPIVA